MDGDATMPVLPVVPVFWEKDREGRVRGTGGVSTPSGCRSMGSGVSPCQVGSRQCQVGFRQCRLIDGNQSHARRGIIAGVGTVRFGGRLRGGFVSVFSLSCALTFDLTP